MFHLSIVCGDCRVAFDVLASLEESSLFTCPRCGEVSVCVKKIRGFVYVLSNELMPGIVKIGFTERTVAERIGELSAHTGVAVPYLEEASFPVEEPETIEELIHTRLDACRVSQNREFFRLPTSEAIAAVREILGIKLPESPPSSMAKQAPPPRDFAAESAAEMKKRGVSLGGFGSSAYEDRS
jgi:hypothetical protein